MVRLGPRELGSPSSSATRSAYRLEIAIVSQSQFVEAVDAHHLDLTRISGQIEADDDDEVGQHQDAALEVVAFAFAINVAEQENAEDDSHHVPLREDEVECVLQELFGFDVPPVHGAKEDKGGDLEQANLQGISRTNLHRQRDVTIHSERDGVLCIEC